MSRFRKSDKGEMPELNTSSLPDLIFTILFFFMIVTSMREEEVKVEFNVPKGTEITKLEKKSLSSYIYVGKPKDKSLGSTHQIQINDKVQDDESGIRPYIAAERDKMATSYGESEAAKITMVLKADKTSQMGLITRVKLECRKANALNFVYSATKSNQ